MQIREGGLDDPQVIALLRFHLESMHAQSPPGSVYAFDVSGLQRADVSFFTVWDGDVLLGCAALRELSAAQGELKSMRTLPAALRRGVAAALLRHVIDTARQRGYRVLSLETGSGAAFEPALALYARFGFVRGAAFGDYAASAFNQFLHLALDTTSADVTSATP